MQLALPVIKKFESLHDGNLHVIGLQPKLCPAGIWTVGWGRAVTDPATGKFLRGAEGKQRAVELYPALTEAEAEVMLMEDYQRFEDAVKALLQHTATAAQLAAMTSLAYNIGVANFKKSSVLRHFNNNNLEAAAAGFNLWVKADGKVLRGLQRRRKEEEELFRQFEN